MIYLKSFESFSYQKTNEELRIEGKDLTIEDLSELLSRLGFEYKIILKILKKALDDKGYEGVVDMFNDFTRKETEIKYVGNGYFNIITKPFYNKYRTKFGD